MAIPYSFEFFPPKTPEGAEKLCVERQALYALKPDYCSVTFGAGGSTQAGTLETVKEIMAEGMMAAPHLSCVGQTRTSIRERLQEFQAAGLDRVVALRGDLPSGYGLGGEFHHANELVEFIRAETGDHFRIAVAAYPEGHPQARSMADDLKAYATKVKAGATLAITQLFFNADAYFRFVDDAQRLGADVPVVAGIMPITRATQLLRFADSCGAEVPRWIRQRLISYGDDTESIREFGLEVVHQLCAQLEKGGAPGLHFYTMNNSQATSSIIRRLGW